MVSLLMKIAFPFAVCVGIICSFQGFYIWLMSPPVLVKPSRVASGTPRTEQQSALTSLSSGWRAP